MWSYEMARSREQGKGTSAGRQVLGHPTRAAAHLLAKAAAGDEVDQGIEQGVAGEGLDQQAPVHVCLSKVHRSIADDCTCQKYQWCRCAHTASTALAKRATAHALTDLPGALHDIQGLHAL